MTTKTSAEEDRSDNAGDNEEPLPPLAAAFLILFDLKVGYSIAWKRSIPDIELDGAVEYKSLPSGLHNVKEDLIYFTHGDYAGISAFVSSKASESERNARLIAVGILVPLSSGRLGQSWLHAQKTQDIAAYIAKNTTDTKPLEDFWDKYRIDARPTSDVDTRRQSLGPISLSNGGLSPGKSRGYSNTTGAQSSEQALHPSHPARSLLRFLDTFGPLSFPLYRAGLLRKRILIIAEPPVRESCNFVYDLSIISTIPSSAADILFSNSPLKDSAIRYRALFSVGVHDIPQLSATTLPPPQQQGWVACSTDEVLAMKTQLYDIVVELPPGYVSTQEQEQHKRWPIIKTSSQKPIKATQRDLRRYRILRQELHALTNPNIPSPNRSTSQPYRDDPEPPAADADAAEASDTDPLLSSQSSEPNSHQHPAAEDDDHPTTIIEPRTWSALAYSSFLWWASAGERDPVTAPAEEAHDRSLFSASLSALATPSPGRSPRSKRRASVRPTSLYGAGGAEMAVVAYFQQMTARLVEGLAEVVERELAEEGEDASEVRSAEGPGEAGVGEVEGGGDEDEEEDAEREAERRSAGGDGADEDEDGDGDRENGEEEDSEPILINADDLAKLGLDSWSASDKVFVEEAMHLWFGREAEVRMSGVECCGVRIL